MAGIATDINKVIVELEIYIDNNNYPILDEFFLNTDTVKTTRFYELCKENETIANLNKKAIKKQELFIQRKLATSVKAETNLYFLAKCKHGWMETTKVINENHEVIETLSEEDLKERIEKLQKQLSR